MAEHMREELLQCGQVRALRRRREDPRHERRDTVELTVEERHRRPSFGKNTEIERVLRNRRNDCVEVIRVLDMQNLVAHRLVDARRMFLTAVEELRCNRRIEILNLLEGRQLSGRKTSCRGSEP